MRLNVYLTGVVTCTLLGLVYGLLRRRHFKNKPSLGCPVNTVNVPWFELVIYSALGTLAGIIWPFLVIFIVISYVYDKVEIKMEAKKVK